MDKAEALEFIGLKEPLAEEALLQKYTERFNYYHMLYENAPSKVIEKIQQQNLEKLKLVRKILLDEIDLKKKDFNRRFSEPGDKPEPPAQPSSPEKAVAGWLIVHTENKPVQTFDLYEGINYIGRKKRDDGAGCIVLDDDRYVSRTHALIKVKSVGSATQFVLYDGDGSKPSANGVFLNGKEKRVAQYCSLAESDTIQIGMTKLVLKIAKENRSVTGEIEAVMKTDFIRSIDIGR
ncbi:MAG TPA: FHA domain-containing protein [Flavisolibacter sp.]|jgi:pSer/pThr/pTyr-binding forkhead associated (FHA) protein